MSNKENGVTQTPKNQRKRFLLFGAISLAALVLCTAVVIGVALSLITEGAYVFPEQESKIIALTPCPAQGADTVEFLDRLIKKATDDTKVFLNTSTEVSYDNIVISTGEGEDAMRYLLQAFFESVKGMYPDGYNGSFDDGYTGYPLIDFTDGSCTSALCTEGVADESGEYYDTDNYYISMTVPGGEYPHTPGSSVYKNFRLNADSQLLDRIFDEASSFFTVKSYVITPGDFTVESVSDRLTDRLSSVLFTRFYHASFTVAFAGDFSSLGERTFEFDYSVADRYNYTWAGLTLSEDTLRLSKGDTHELALNAVINDDSEYEVLFTSSDESIATVDDMGYVTAVSESAQPVTITVKLTYLGNEYQASCQLTVTTPVEKIVISDDELSLKVGSSASLSAKLKPDNATINDIIWVSEDEAVATVDENGNVTGVKSGTVKVFAVAKDGFLKDSCTVSVTA